MAEITNSIGVTHIAPFIPEIWSAKVIDEYVTASIIGDRLDRRFEADLKYGDQVNRGLISKVTPKSRSTNTDLTYNTVSETWVNCTINQDYYIFRMLEPIAKLQSMIDVLNEYTKMDGKAMAEKVDTDVATLFNTLNNSSRKGTLTADATDDNLIDCVTALNVNNVPGEERSWFISPETWASLMKIDKYIMLDYVKPGGETAVESAQLNRPIYGAPVFVTNAIQGDATNGHNCALVQREAIMLIVQQNPKVVKAWDTRRGCDTILTECIWGKVEARDKNGVCLQAK